MSATPKEQAVKPAGKGIMFWIMIIVKNWWQFAIVIGIALCLIKGIGAGSPWRDATRWPAFAKASISPETAPAPTASKDSSEPKPPHKEALHGKAVHGILLVTAFSFIFLNTVTYLWQNRKATRPPDWRLGVAWFVITFFEVVTIIWIIKLVFGWPAERICKFPDEKLALLMFFVFAVVDLLYWKADAKHAKDRHYPNAEDDSQFALNQSLYVDVPVVVGILISVCLAHHLTSRFSDSEMYLAGFFSGATVMHLVASQIIYSLLASRRDYWAARRGS